MGMEGLEKLLELMGSPTRLKVMEALAVRPRSLAELASLLGVTRQGALKHLNALEQAGYVESWKAPREAGLVVRQLYRLIKPVKIFTEAEEGLLRVSIDVAESRRELDADKARLFIAERTLIELFQAISEDEYELMRRLRSVREREKRVILEFLDLQQLKDRVIKDSDCTPLEEAMLLTYALPEGEIEIAKMIDYLKISKEKARRIWDRLRSKKAMIR